MDFIQTVFSSPLPVAISAVIAIAALAGYWFFVIPMGEANKELREQNAELQSKLGAEFDQQKANVQRFMQELTAGLQSQQNITELVTIVGSLKLTVDNQSALLGNMTERMLQDIQESLDRINQALTSTSGTSNRKTDDIGREVDRLSRLLETLSRQISDISDKQSQVAGVLTGMSIAHANRSL